MKTIMHQFRDFVAKKAAEGGTFNYWSGRTCALAQFGQSLGYADAVGGPNNFNALGRPAGFNNEGNVSVLLATTIPHLMGVAHLTFFEQLQELTEVRWSDLLSALDRHMSISADYRDVTPVKELADA